MQATDSKSPSVFDYIFGLTVPGVKLELSRVEAFLQRLGNPFSKYPVIHIAGTNGKGSTAAMLAAILNAFDIKTGLFTSPHLVKPNERIRIGGALVPDEFIIEKVDEWRPHIDELGITFFEVLTALGMVYFHEQKVDYAIFETGLGGRLDATNVVDPIMSIITAISMDHENILGNTLEKITLEKAGIIKAKRPVLLGQNVEQVKRLVESKCHLKEAPFNYVPDRVTLEKVEPIDISQRLQLSFDDQTYEFLLPLLGRHQAENFSNVLMALNALDLPLDQRIIQNGLDQLNWKGRIQLLQAQPRVLYDVAHNAEGLDRLLESLSEAGLGDTILIAAFNARKKISALIESLDRWQGGLLFTRFEGHSAVGHQELIQQGVNTELIEENPQKAYERALGMRQHDKQAICFFGSHYLAESLFELFQVQEAEGG